MARIPVSEGGSRFGIALPRPDARRPVADAVQGLLATVAEGVQRNHAANLAQRRRTGMAEAQAGLVRRLAEIDTELAQNPGDGTDLVERGFTAGQEAIRDRLERIDDPVVRAELERWGVAALGAQAQRQHQVSIGIQRTAELRALDTLQNELLTATMLGSELERDGALQTWEARLDASGWLTEDDKTAAVARFMESQTAMTVEALIGTGDVEGANEILADADAPLAPDTRAKLMSASQLRAERDKSERQARNLSDVLVEIGEGGGSVGQIESLYAQDRLSPAGRERARRTLASRLSTGANVAAATARVESVMGGLEPLVVTTGYRKDVEAHFGAQMEEQPDLTTEEFLAFGTAYAERAGVLPKAFSGRLDGALRTGNAQDGVLAARTVEDIRNRAPVLLRDMPEGTLEMANLISTFARTDPQNAVAQAREVVGKPAAERELLRDRWDSLDREDPTTEWLKERIGEVGGFWFGIGATEAEIPPALEAEVLDAERRIYERTGHRESARETALDGTLGTWGFTRVGGPPRWMRLPPEVVHGTGSPDDAEWMQDDLVTDTRALIGYSDSFRPDGSRKGDGFLGPLPVKGGGVATEWTIPMPTEDGTEIEVPTLVPTLTTEEIEALLTDLIPNEKQLPRSIIDKAHAHARERIAAGLSPFAKDGPSVINVPPDLAGLPDDAFAERVVLVGDFRTTQVGDYAVVAFDEFGTPFPLKRADGQDWRWKPEADKSLALAAERAENVQAGRRRRELMNTAAGRIVTETANALGRTPGDLVAATEKAVAGPPLPEGLDPDARTPVPLFGALLFPAHLSVNRERIGSAARAMRKVQQQQDVTQEELDDLKYAADVVARGIE